MYLRSLSLNSVSEIFRSWFDIDVFSKDTLINHIEKYTDQIPGHFQITEWLKPTRSGFYALDGTWLKYRGKDIVLLILLDVKTLDIVSWRISRKETREAYDKLLVSAYAEIANDIKGIHCDGDPGLLLAIKDLFPETPIQLCVFHKYSRAGQLIPFIRIKNETDGEIKRLTERVLFAPTKQEAIPVW